MERTKVEVLAEMQKINKLKNEIIKKGVSCMKRMDELKEELKKCKE